MANFPASIAPTYDDVKALAGAAAGTRVTVYADPGLARTAVAKAVAKVVAKTESAALAEQGKVADQILADIAFSRDYPYDIGVFVDAESARVFTTCSRGQDFAVVGNSFYLPPLIPALEFPGSALILALSANSVRVIEISVGHKPVELKVPGLPTDLRSTTNLDLTNDRETLSHLRTVEDPKIRDAEFARAVDVALRPLLAAKKAPLVIAAAEPLASIFRQVSTYDTILETGIVGNPEPTALDTFAMQTYPLLEALYAQQLAAIKSRWENDVPSTLIATSFDEIIAAAEQHAVEAVVVVNGGADTSDVSLDSSLSDTLTALQGTPPDERVNEVLRRVLLTDARVFVVAADQVPRGKSVCAKLRFVVAAV